MAATATPVYFSNQNASETCPEVELGYDFDKTSVYESEFEVTNTDNEETVTDVIESTFLTETIAADHFIGSAYGNVYLDLLAFIPEDNEMPALLLVLRGSNAAAQAEAKLKISSGNTP